MAKIFKITGANQYKSVSTHKDVSFGECASKSKKPKREKLSPTPKAKESLVSIAKKPKSDAADFFAISACIDAGRAISAPRLNPERSVMSVKRYKSPSPKKGTKAKKKLALAIESVHAVFLLHFFEIAIQKGSAAIPLKK